jgi:RNA polymerase sigma-70 factor (ECF subfamily)
MNPPELKLLDSRSAHHLSDEHLMRLLKGGEVRAFEVLVKRHHPAVTSLARYACGSDLADDVAQAAFVSLWQHRTKYDARRGSPRSWLLAIARNRGVDMMRSRGSRSRHIVSADPHGWLIVAADQTLVAEAPHTQVEREESSAAVRRQLETLPPAQRTVIELAYLDGLTQQEIALALSMPLGTVKSRLRLGLAKLRAAWAEDDDRLLSAA